MSAVQITYSSLSDIKQALNLVRGNRYYMPRYAWIAEAVRLLIVIIPVLFFVAGLIGESALIAFIIGYLITRIFEKRFKPLIYQKFGPHFSTTAHAWPMTIKLEPSGLRMETPSSQSCLGWAALPLPELRDNGMLIRVEPERSVPIKATDLPKGVTCSELLASIQQWRMPG